MAGQGGAGRYAFLSGRSLSEGRSSLQQAAGYSGEGE